MFYTEEFRLLTIMYLTNNDFLKYMPELLVAFCITFSMLNYNIILFLKTSHILKRTWKLLGKVLEEGKKLSFEITLVFPDVTSFVTYIVCC